MKVEIFALNHEESQGRNLYSQFSVCARRPRQQRRVTSGAFTLLELLVVMAIAVLLISLSSVAFTQIATGSRLERAGQTVEDQIILAQQEALTRNRKVEVRILQISTGGVQQWRGIQVLRFEENGSLTSVSKISVLPDGTGLSAVQSLSPLLFPPSSSTYTPLVGTTNTPAYGNVAYRAFCFLPNGSLAGAPGSGNYLTFQNNATSSNPPPNYYTVQVNPVTGKVTSYRP